MDNKNPYESLYDEDYFKRLHQLNLTGNNVYREQQRLETIEVLCSPSSDDLVLELGCGTGLYTRLLAPRVRKIVGVDFSSIAIEQAIAQGKESNLEFIVGDIQNLAMFPDQTFDKILAIDLVEHLSNPQLENSLGEIARLLKKDGLFIFFTPCRSHWIERLKGQNFVLKQFEEHVGVRTEVEYRRIIRHVGLDVKTVLHYETCIPGLRVFERVFKKAPIIGNLFVSRLGIAVSK